MAKPILTYELRGVIQPLLPERPPRPNGGHSPLEDRAVLTGILFGLKTGISWECLPKEPGCGSGMTCWRRLQDWHEDGVWTKVHKVLLDRLASADNIDFSRAVIDSGSLRAVFGGPKQGKNPRTVVRKDRNTMSSTDVSQAKEKGRGPLVIPPPFIKTPNTV